MLVENRNGLKEQYVGLEGESTKLSFSKGEERGAMWLLLWQQPPNHFHA